MKMNRTASFALVLISTIAPCVSQAVGFNPFAVEYVGQLQPTSLPGGIAFGGGGNSFERRVDLSGNLGVVGAGLFRQGADQGHAYVFDYSNPTNIHQIADLRATDHAAGNEFGDGVAISGNYVFVGAWGDSGDRGAVYMYDVSDPQHIVERKITAFDAAPDNAFGFSLAVDGTRLIVGAPKFTVSSLPAAAYIVDFSDPNHITQKKLPSSIPGLGSGYGLSVGISGNYAIVGRPSDSAEFPFAGSAYLYDLTNLNAIVEKRIKPTDAPNYSGFGDRVSISGKKVLVSSTSDPGPGNPAGASEGTVWAFDFSNWNSIKQSEYGRSTFHSGDFTSPFGRFLDLQGNLGIAAAFNEDGTRGAVYFNDVSNVLAPTELYRLPAHASDDSRFGRSLAIDGSMMLVSDSNNHVYLYQVVPEAGCMTLATIAFCCSSCLRRRTIAPLRRH